MSEGKNGVICQENAIEDFSHSLFDCKSLSIPQSFLDVLLKVLAEFCAVNSDLRVLKCDLALSFRSARTDFDTEKLTTESVLSINSRRDARKAPIKPIYQTSKENTRHSLKKRTTASESAVFSKQRRRGSISYNPRSFS